MANKIEKKRGLKKLSTRNTISFRGGAKTDQEKALLEIGEYSMIQNMRPKHPGFVQRKGLTRAHTTNDGTNKVLNLYQFSKGKRTERAFFAQMSDGDLLEATNAPPAVTTGAFGAEVHDGGSGQKAAAFSHFNDVMIYSNGVDQHQLYPGDGNYVDSFWVYDGTEDELKPTLGKEYSLEISDGDSTTVAILDSLDVWANFACLYVHTPVPANKLTFTIPSKPNATASVATAYYWKNDESWADTSASDGTEVLTLDVAPGTAWSDGVTITGGTSGETCIIVDKITDLTYQVSNRSGAFTLGEILSDGTYAADQGAVHPTIHTLSASGSFTWTAPSDEIPKEQFGKTGYWYQIRVTVQLDAEVEVSSVTYGGDFCDLENVWNGTLDYLIEAIFDDDSASLKFTYPTNAIDISDMTTSDKILLSSYDKLMGLFIDVGSTPNTETTTTIVAGDIEYWNGSAWTSVGTPKDHTAGLNNSGAILWDRMSDDYQRYLPEAQYTAYWYRLNITTATVTGDPVIAISGIPYFEMATLGKGGTSTIWKDRACYSFN